MLTRVLDKTGRVVRSHLWRVEWYAKRRPWSGRGLARVAHALSSRPSRRLGLIGVTGTNGKTTTAWIVHEALERLGSPAGLLSTVEVRTGQRAAAAWLTTPNSIDLAFLLREMVRGGCRACVMEVSSHALQEHRTSALEFDVGVFTNLSREHMDYHGTLESYADAKARLFEQLSPGAVAVLNRDDPAWERMARDTRARIVTFGQVGGTRTGASRMPRNPPGTPDVPWSLESDTLDGLAMTLDGERRRFRLIGAFNGANLAGAYGVLRARGHSRDDALEALTRVEGPPGRMEVFRPVGEGSGPTVVVDFAHTPDAYERLLLSARGYLRPGGRLFIVFGSGGGRDPRSRPLLGEVASRLADGVVLTEMNPRNEDPDRIIDQIRSGMVTEPMAIIRGRKAALRHAIGSAGSGDLVLITGKGHERTEEIRGVKFAHDDREVVRACGYTRERVPEASGTCPARSAGES